MAERTAPKEKNTERAMRRCCFRRGMFSMKSVPSVGMLPLGGRVREEGEGEERESEAEAPYSFSWPRRRSTSSNL